MALNVAIIVVTVVGMEGIAWWMHKYVMHGFMWHWHHSHHNHHPGLLERNDWFSVLFSLLTIILIIVGFEIDSCSLLASIGIGMTIYGLFYALFHDIIVHRRIHITFKPRHPYLKRIIRAHYIHHKVHTKEGAEAFGFLYASKKYKITIKKGG